MTVLLYADDTALFAENEEKLPVLLKLNDLSKYCNDWKQPIISTKLRLWFFETKYVEIAISI